MSQKPPAVYHEHQLLRFQDCTTDVRLDGTTASLSVIPAKAGFTVYVRKISGHLSTPGSTLTFQDTAGTPSVLAVVSSASSGGITVLDAFSKGVALAADQGLDLVGDAAAAVGVFYIEAYYWPSTPNAI
jgi:hypothetical protein